MLSYVETRPQVIAYFDVKTKEADIISLKDQIEKTGKTSSVNYVSQAAALKIYKDLNKDNPLLLEMVSANILPASLEIFATKPVYLSELAEFLRSQPSVDEVNYQKSIVDRLVVLTNILRHISIALLILLLTITVTVLITTTAFKISIKREEIEVLQLIGASKSYIRKPFIVEGMLFGIISGTVAFVLFYAIFFSFQPAISAYLTGLPVDTYKCIQQPTKLNLSDIYNDKSSYVVCKRNTYYKKRRAIDDAFDKVYKKCNIESRHHAMLNHCNIIASIHRVGWLRRKYPVVLISLV
jgi:cell division transport system permease protein